MRGVRGLLVILVAQVSGQLCGQGADRLVIMADRDPANVVVQQERSRLASDAAAYFGLRPDHIHQIDIDPSTLPPPEESESTAWDAWLKEAETFCARPEETVWVAFVFSTREGPDAASVLHFLRKAKARVKVLSTRYATMHLTELSGSRFPLLAYARGETGRRDTVEKKDGKFPLIPVIAGGAALATGGIILLTAGKDEEGCTVVDPSWILPPPLCPDGAPVQLEVSGTAGGTWSGPGVTAGGLFNPGAGTQAVTYTVGEGTCRQSRTQTIEVNQPVADWTVPGQPCEGELITLVPQMTGGTWTGPGILQQPDGTASFSQPQAGQYAVNYAVVLGGCAASSTQSITVIPDADASWMSPGQICSGETRTLTTSGTPGGRWTGDGITDLGDGTATFTASAPGSYAVTYTAGSGECMASLTQAIEVVRTPDPGWPLPGPLCVSDQITLAPSGDGGGTWSGDGVTDLGNGTATFVQSAAGSYAVTYAVTSGSCTGTLTQSIDVLEVADPAWNAPGPRCTGSTILLVPTGTPGGSWSGEGVTDLGDGTALFAPGTAGSFPVTYTVGVAPCGGSRTLDIQVVESPIAAWQPPADICAGSTIPLSPSGTPGGTWSGSGVTDAGDGTATFFQAEPGNYAVTYAIVTGECGDTLTQAVSVLPVPDPSWLPPSDACAGQQVTLTPSGTPGGTWSGEGITDLGDGTASFLAQTAGTVSITYSISLGPCSNSLTQDITVFLAADAAWMPPAAVCTGQIVTLTPSGTPGGMWTGEGVTDLGDGTAQFLLNEAGIAQVTYAVQLGPCSDTSTQQIQVIGLADPSWNPPTDVCINETVVLVPTGTPGGTWSGPGVTNQGDGTALFTQSEAGAFAVTYTAGQGACQQSSTQDIVVVSTGDPTWVPPQDLVCPGTTVTLSAPVGNWSGPGVTNYGNGSGEFVSNEPGAFTVTLTVGSGDCTASESHDINVGDDEAPVIDFPAEDETVSCDGDGNVDELDNWLDNHGWANASDNCDATLTWSHDYPGFPFDCGYAGSVEVVFTVTDDAGNEATTLATFTILDEEPPMFNTIPGDIVVPCDDIPAPPVVTAVDECSGPAQVTFDEAPPGPGCPYEIVRSWIATDECGNTAYAEQVITAVDNVAPEIIFAPPGMNIECPGPPESCIPPIVDAIFIDNCDPDPLISFDELIIPLPPSGLNVIRCWFATDACGNVSETYCQSIFIFTLAPPEAPALPPGSLNLSVGAMAPGVNLAFSPAQAHWTDAGPLQGIDLVPLRKTGQQGVWPVFGAEWEKRLNPKASVLLGAYMAGFEERQRYSSHYGFVDFRGRIHIQRYDLTLRLRPEPAGRVFYTVGPRYVRVNMRDLVLEDAGGIHRSASRLSDFEFFIGGGAGGQWPIGRAGRIEVMLEIGTNHTASLRTGVTLGMPNPLHALTSRMP